MRVKIEKGLASGCVKAPPSKSVAHRLLIAAALADGESVINGISLCEDVLATASCLNAMGADIRLCGDKATVRGFDPLCCEPKEELFANESGSTLRFLIPIALLSDKPIVFSGSGRLMERPLSVYERLCEENGMTLVREDGKIKVCGPFKATEIELPGNVSSQFISGLLFILPFLGGDRRIKINTKTESRSYIDLTLKAMNDFGIDAIWENENTLLVKDGAKYSPRCANVEGDYSAAAFTDALGCLGGRVSVKGLREDSLQGDRVYAEHFSALKLGCPEISLEDCPDLGPILFTIAAACNGGRFTDTARLKIKESDRAAVMAEELRKFGAELEVLENEVIVRPARLHAPTEILFGHNDHRIVMSLAVLCTKYGGIIEGAEAIRKSYPTFFSDLSALNIEVHEYEA